MDLNFGDCFGRENPSYKMGFPKNIDPSLYKMGFPKNLDTSYKMDLNFGDCFGRENLSYSKIT